MIKTGILTNKAQCFCYWYKLSYCYLNALSADRC